MKLTSMGGEARELKKCFLQRQRLARVVHAPGKDESPFTSQLRLHSAHPSLPPHARDHAGSDTEPRTLAQLSNPTASWDLTSEGGKS